MYMTVYARTEWYIKQKQTGSCLLNEKKKKKSTLMFPLAGIDQTTFLSSYAKHREQPTFPLQIYEIIFIQIYIAD